MVLSKIVVNVYAVLLEAALWLFLIAGFISGWAYKGFFGAIIGVIFFGIFGAAAFGALLVLNDIRDRLKNIESTKSAQKGMAAN